MLVSLIVNFGLSQQYPWTGKCDNANFETEISACLSKSCEEAKVYFEKTYDTFFNKVQMELKNSTQGTIQYEILSKYITYLPRLKNSLAENAICMSELESAAEISGSGHEIFKKEIYLKVIENNITLLKNMEAELPSFN